MSYDIYLDPSSTERKPFGFGYAQALKVTGASRVAQRFLKHLLTPAGTDPSGDVPGTNLPWLVMGDVADPLHLNTVATLAVDSAADQVRRITETGGGEGPGLLSATITNLQVDVNKLDIYIKLLTTEGSVALMIPVPVSSASQTAAPIIATYQSMLSAL